MDNGLVSREFKFRLTNTKKKFYFFFAFLNIIINIVIHLLITLSEAQQPFQNGRLLTKFLYVILFTVLFFLKEEKSKKVLIVLSLTLIISAWILMNEWLPATINLLFGFLFIISIRPLEIKVNKDNISYPSFPIRKISWNELNNIILKDGLLTIDLKNNKVWQHYPEETKPVDEAAFNLFCKQHLQITR